MFGQFNVIFVPLIRNEELEFFKKQVLEDAVSQGFDRKKFFYLYLCTYDKFESIENSLFQLNSLQHIQKIFFQQRETFFVCPSFHQRMRIEH